MNQHAITIRVPAATYAKLLSVVEGEKKSLPDFLRQTIEERLQRDNMAEAIERAAANALGKVAAENKAALNHIESQLAAVVTALAAARPAPAAPVPGRLQSPDLIRDTSRKS